VRRGAGEDRLGGQPSPQAQHRGCKFVADSRDSDVMVTLPRERKGLESIGYSFWEFLRPRIQQVK